MASDLAALRRERTTASTRMSELAAAARGRSMTDDEQRDFDAAASKVAALDAQITSAEADGDQKTASSLSRADAAEIARICTAGGVPAMAATMLAEGVGIDEAKKRVAAVGQAQGFVTLARRKDASIPADLATTMLAEGKTAEDVRAACFDKLVAGEEKAPVSSHLPADAGNAGFAASANSMEREIKRAGMKKDD